MLSSPMDRISTCLWSCPEEKIEKTYGVLELCVDFCDDFPHLLQFGKHVFLRRTTSEHGLHLSISTKDPYGMSTGTEDGAD